MTTEIQEQEIAFDQAVAEEEPEVVAPEKAPTTEDKREEAQEILDTLKPKTDPKTWTIGEGDFQRTYVQRPLSFIAKMQWFSLVGDVLDKALSGPSAMSMNSLFMAPGGGRAGQLTLSDFRDADTFIQALGKLLSFAPDFLLDSYVIWLTVPDHERPLAKQILSLPEEDGGLSDRDGIEIVEIFIDQNYDALDDFFRVRLVELRRRVEARQKTAKEAASHRSKR